MASLAKAPAAFGKFWTFAVPPVRRLRQRAAAGSQNRIDPMLDAMRRGVANILAKILLGLLIVAFAVWGIGDYSVRGARTGPLATVGKTQISVEDFQQALKDETQALGRRLGRAITPEQAQLLGLGPRALARLIGFAALDQHASALGITVTDAIVRGSIVGDPTFHGPDGKFSRQQFDRLVRDSGYRSEGQYIEARRRDLSRQQLTETLGAGVAPQLFLIDALHRYRNEKRAIEHLTPDFAKLVTVAE